MGRRFTTLGTHADPRVPAQTAAAPPAQMSTKAWIKRAGWAGILFFLTKGLLWLLIPYLGARGLLQR